ncbi:hypothetical protein [Fervidibacillus halotolerans]|uniref:Uncharacterized protein n=1 Tax=Fervidibacillus halotolerans TaxID=2980027 RepID=A0A9E8RZ25_9BACI|nr:hypothetical protein [Fervidibacillus halotolerans]WAA12749.1 hypothetical protein OE105_00970 [Fervidibacillus halotolerans]
MVQSEIHGKKKDGGGDFSGNRTNRRLDRRAYESKRLDRFFGKYHRNEVNRISFTKKGAVQFELPRFYKWLEFIYYFSPIIRNP